jgi:hypothetical protein
MKRLAFSIESTCLPQYRFNQRATRESCQAKSPSPALFPIGSAFRGSCIVSSFDESERDVANQSKNELCRFFPAQAVQLGHEPGLGFRAKLAIHHSVSLLAAVR